MEESGCHVLVPPRRLTGIEVGLVLRLVVVIEAFSKLDVSLGASES